MRSTPGDAASAEIPARDRRDTDAAYVRYTLDFFHRWLPYYDLFARSIFWAYGSLVRCVAPRSGMKILDLCTGTGEVSLRCARSGATVTAVDLSPDMLARARHKAKARRLDLDLCRTDARRLPFPDRSFEVVTLSFALHDMPRRVQLAVLREAARLARHRLLVLDYDLPRSPILRRLARTGIGLFESPFFTRFVDEDTSSRIEAAGLPTPRVVRDPSHLFSIFEVDLSGR